MSGAKPKQPQAGAIFWECCGVAGLAFSDDPCWYCGEEPGRDVWNDLTRQDDDTLVRKYVVLHPVKSGKPIL
jgi:hypothetical protein